MKYDPFQKKAIEYIQKGYSVLVSAPTGAGKTAIAEHVVAECLKRNERVVYTAPIKALSNQKFRDFAGSFPDKVGILTGDVSINPSASTLIMTTEIFRNKILEEKSSLNTYSWIIFDEIHYIDDYERGSVWEESLMFLPDHMKVLGLSATIPNADDLASWFESIHGRPIKIVREEKRPVPLHICYQCQNRLYDQFQEFIKEGFRGIDTRLLRGRQRVRYSAKKNRLMALIQDCVNNKKLPCIYFVFSRRKTESLADEICDINFLSQKEKEKILRQFDNLCHKFDLKSEPSAAQMRPLIEKGIAYHHAGMLPTLKEVIERLFTSKLIKVIFTTETFALGINMPARTVIFDELSKFYGYTYGVLRTRDFYQMAGRAGRRSIDKEGFVFCRVNPTEITPAQIERVIYGQPEEIRSHFNAGYATILNLYEKYGEGLYNVYRLSFHYYLERKFIRKRAMDMLRAKVKILKDLGYIRKNQLTSKGKFASKVYGYEFILSELYEDGTLDGLPETVLGVLAVALVFEPRKGISKSKIYSRQIKYLEKKTEKLMSTIHRIERKARVQPLSKKAYWHLALAMEAWIKGKSFSAVLKMTDVDEGEVVRYFRMSMQNLRELLDAPVSDNLKMRTRNLIRRINRDVVDSEKQLRS